MAIIIILLLFIGYILITKKSPLDDVKKNYKKYITYLIVAIILYFLLAKSINKFIAYIKDLFKKDPYQQDDNNTINQSQIDTVVSKFIVAFNSTFTTDQDILNILDPLTSNDFLAVKNEFGLWFYEPNLGVLANDSLSLAFSSYNLIECIQMEVSDSTWQQIANKFNDILI